MAGLVSEPTGEVIQGTDAALPALSKPEVEVTFATAKPSNGMPMDPDSGRANRIAIGIRKLRESGGTTGKVPPAPLKVEKAEPEKTPEVKPEATKPPEPKAPEVKPDERPAATAAPEKPVESPPVVEPEKQPEPEPKPDPVALASTKADLEAAHAELALTRERLARAQTGTASDDDRRTYISRPLDGLRGYIARTLGVKPDAPEVASELAYLQRELTYDAIGADTLPDERKQQRVTDRFDRSERLTELGRAASEAATKETEIRTRVVGHVASVIEAAKDEFPDLAYVPHLFNGASPAEIAVDLWTDAVRNKRIQATGDDAKDVREALRLASEFTKQRLGKLQRPQPQNTAPAPATPDPAPTGAAPGTAAAPESPAPAKKAGSAPPKTLPPSSNAAPVARAPEPEKTKSGPVVVDPHDRDGRKNRILEIARKNRK